MADALPLQGGGGVYALRCGTWHDPVCVYGKEEGMSEPPIIGLRNELARDIISGAVVVRDTEITMLEDEIERRGLEDDYIRALLAIVIPDGGSVLAFWRILRATPEQRARAFLEATKI